jgi:hypothetical protein
MNDYTAAEWKGIFAFNGLRTFDDFWKLEAKWFEEPNKRRGGWSGVARCELKLPEGGKAAVFLKRQENHITRTFTHPIRGLSTFVREFAHTALLCLPPGGWKLARHSADRGTDRLPVAR